MATFSFTVPGIIKGKGRPRFVRATGRAYTPQATLSSENLVKHCALDAGATPFEGALSLEIWLRLPVPASWPAKKRAAALCGALRPVGKPDLDNVIKLIGDALNKIAWNDDGQVATVTASRHYAEESQVGATISIQQI